MISAQDLIEKILAKATSDDCIVVIKEKSLTIRRCNINRFCS